MPVDLRSHDPDDGIDIDPGTNKAAIVKLLYGNPNLGYKPSEIREQLDLPSGSVTTSLLRLHEDGQVGKTADGYYHALESRDDLRRFASSLVQVESLTSRYETDDLTPADAEQTKSREDQLDDLGGTNRGRTDAEAELEEIEDDLE